MKFYQSHGDLVKDIMKTADVNKIFLAIFE